MPPADETWTIGRLLTWTVDFLGKHGSENPRLDAEVLLAEARGSKRIDLYAAYGEVASDEVRTAFRELVRRRSEGTPVAYLVGRREFYSLDFAVNSDVLIPRPDTELLVVALLDDVKKRAVDGNTAETFEIVDVGTGSGILAVCAAKYVPSARVTAIDISPGALAVARHNAETHHVAARIMFVEGNLLTAEPAEPRFDYILSNPPYISTAEMAELARDVRDYEPHVALEAGEHGTDIVQPLIEQAVVRLKPGGMLLIEVSPMIAAKVEEFIQQQALLELRPTLRDLAGHARVVQAIRREK